MTGCVFTGVQRQPLLSGKVEDVALDRVFSVVTVDWRGNISPSIRVMRSVDTYLLSGVSDPSDRYAR